MEKVEGKVVEMTPQAKSEKMSYEELEKVAHQLSEQIRQLYTKLQSANMTNLFKRIDYLFKVLENKEAFNSEFVIKCVEELETVLTLTEKDNSEEQD